MPISYCTFQNLPFEQQLPLVWAEGTLLAKRWQAGLLVALYLMDESFCCEVYQEQNYYTGLRLLPFATPDDGWWDGE
ncbi:hypothetical protein [Hymenobacter sp. YC55]|uniref:hypothetical protein n=1 Tax=Hymenobacter sp. YC55 TaxID=3034019 RepID=UPI0023F7B35C|nr:hypothetical protein [Hymenobacter sp. YC55]MDF7815176.1 hypothetical protein [Hymenobacter sp. YC55]